MVSANERWLADTCSLNKAISSPVGFRTWYVFMTIFPLLYCSIIFIYLQSFRIMNRCVPFTKTTESTLRLQNGPCQPRPYGHRPPSSSYRDVQFASGNCRIYQIRETRTSRSWERNWSFCRNIWQFSRCVWRGIAGNRRRIENKTPLAILDREVDGKIQKSTSSGAGGRQGSEIWALHSWSDHCSLQMDHEQEHLEISTCFS